MIQGLARQLGCTWRTLRRAIKLEAAAADEARFAGVTTLGVDEHTWHHVSTKPVDLGGREPDGTFGSSVAAGSAAAGTVDSATVGSASSVATGSQPTKANASIARAAACEMRAPFT